MGSSTPDINLIKHTWACLKKVIEHFINSKNEFIQSVRHYWENFPVETYQNPLLNILKRAYSIYKNNGSIRLF